MKETLPIDTAISALELSIEQQVAALRRLKAERAALQPAEPVAPKSLPPVGDPDMVPIHHAARKSGISDNTLRLWCRRDGIGVQPDGIHWIVSMSAVMARKGRTRRRF